ncbi:MAG: acyl-CoA dehydrogenase family protein [Rhodospirillales bacterium]|nr:acyl-CoA dehydrogenase family protein [Rhodospirillales bacterium]MCW8860941.1 acyl-CoA dehydrogenase family protein [Rhodospirillales bacterium]
MDFAFTEEQELLRDSVQRFVRENYPFDKRNKLAETEAGFSSENWAMFAELGWLALPFSEVDGGLDGTVIDTMIMMEEFGKGLTLEPYFPTVVLGGGAMRRAASPAQREAVLPGVIEGTTHLALAYAEEQGRYNLADVATTARADGDGFVLNGRKSVVLNGTAADWLIVSARTAGKQGDAEGVSLFLIDSSTKGIDRRGYRTQDGGRAAEVTLEDVRVSGDALMGEAGAGLAVLEAVIDEAIVAIAAEAVGAMTALNAATVEYSKTRVQFGTPIGKFQALQHRMVEMFMETEQTKSLLYRAAMSMDSGRPDAARCVSALKVQTGKAGRFVGQQAVQIHGGMGMTYELNVGHYFKRLTMINSLFGNIDYHMRRFAALDGTTEAA